MNIKAVISIWTLVLWSNGWQLNPLANTISTTVFVFETSCFQYPTNISIHIMRQNHYMPSISYTNALLFIQFDLVITRYIVECIVSIYVLDCMTVCFPWNKLLSGFVTTVSHTWTENIPNILLTVFVSKN